jgi:hypothetical protein
VDAGVSRPLADWDFFHADQGRQPEQLYVNIATKAPQGGMVIAEDNSKTRSLMITASSSNDGTDVSLTAIEKE